MTNNQFDNHNKHKLLKLILLFLPALLFSTLGNSQTVDLYTVPGSHNFTIPAGVTQITVEAWGGGGAGGGVDKKSAAGGGAGGAYVKSVLTVTPGTTYQIVVAAQKTGTMPNGTSTNGNPSYVMFNATNVVLATGGQGGAHVQSANSNGPGGIGSITGCIFNVIAHPGGNGASGNRSNPGAGGAAGGGAGSTGDGKNAANGAGGGSTGEYGGAGANSAGANSNGLAGQIYGGGGSGAHLDDNSTDKAGGSGAQGLIRITYTVSNILYATATTTSSCQGITPGTGSITVTASGGSSPYQYRLGTGTYQSSDVFTALVSGTYSVTVKDNLNATYTLNNIVVGSQSATMSPLTANVTDASCNLANGAIAVTNIPTALQFSKANSTYVDLGGSLLNDLSQFTLEGWIKIDKSLISGERTWGLFGQNDAVEFGIMNSTTLQLWTQNGGSVNIPMTLYPNDNQWHHVAGVGNGTTLIVYIDGVVVTGTGTPLATSNYGTSTNHSMIGGNIWDATGNFLDGYILKTGFWSRALSASEIANLVTNPFLQYADGQSGLLAGYNYFEGTGSTLSKVGTATTNGTLVNSPRWTEFFTYSWKKTGDASFTASTKDISGISTGTYTITATFPGQCPISGTWTVNSNGVNVWTGSISTDWNNISNWTCAIPDLTIDAIIPSGLSRYPLLSSGASGMCKNIQIQAGATVTVLNNTLQIAGTITNAGFFDVTQGTIELKGTAAQIIPASAFSGNAIANLTINNTNGVTLNGTLYIYGILKATAGTFQTNGNLTLLSTPAQSALIDGSGTGSVIGSVTMQRYLPSSFGYKYFSSPFTNATVGQYAQEINLSASFATIYYYNENVASTGWKAYTATTGALVPGKGYALNFGTSTAAITASVTGIVNNGTIGPFTLYNNNQPYTKGFNLVGNPYPSPIDWNASGWTKTNIDNALYFFDAGTTDQYQGTYSTYINGVSSNGVANNIIPSQQGFFVHVKDGSYPVTGTLTFTNAVRANTLNPYFHKNTLAEDQSLIRLSTNSEGNAVSDYMVVYFNEMASGEFNSDMDALKLRNTEVKVPDLFVLSEDGRELSIKSIAQPGDTYVINLGFASKINGRVTIKAKDLLNIPSGFNVYLKDSYNGYIQDLSESPDYSFTSNSQTVTDRFKLILSRETLNNTGLDQNSCKVFSRNGEIVVTINTDSETMVQLSDLTGRILMRRELPGEGEWTIGQVPAGQKVYLVTLFTGNGVVSKKVYVD